MSVSSGFDHPPFTELLTLLDSSTLLTHLTLRPYEESSLSADWSAVASRLAIDNIFTHLSKTLVVLSFLRLPFILEAIRPLLMDEKSAPRLRKLNWRRDHLDEGMKGVVDRLCEDRGISVFSEEAQIVDELL